MMSLGNTTSQHKIHLIQDQIGLYSLNGVTLMMVSAMYIVWTVDWAKHVRVCILFRIKLRFM